MGNGKHAGGARRDSKTGLRGVSFHRKSEKWTARLVLNGKRITIGYFATPEEASEAYESERRKHFTEDELRKMTPEDDRAYHREHYKRNREKHLSECRSRSKRQKAETIAAYGGACVCCGEHRQEFLTIDHVGGGGRKHKSKAGHQLNGNSLYRWLRDNGYPKSGFRLLCVNCNFAFGMFGYCPHEKEREAVA